MKLRIGIAILSLGAVAEALARLAGLADVPLYEASSLYGYIPAPNQHGRFLANRWYINERHMIDERRFDPGADFALLVGDSIVFGGNPFDQSERVGSLLQAETRGLVIYPIAAGSWGLANELIYLRENDDIASRAKRIIVVSNDADFSQPSAWQCESNHPTHRPAVHLYWVARKYLAPDCLPTTPAQLRPAAVNLAAETDGFMARYGDKTRFVVYPTKALLNRDFSGELRKLSPRIREEHIVNLTRADVRATIGWDAADYKDAIHPNVAGNRKLARLLAATLPAAPHREP